MKDIYEYIKNDEMIIKRYNDIHVFEDKDKGWAYHDFNHILNVAKTMEKILSLLNYDEDTIYVAKIACLLHDTGALEGKEGHALRSYEYAKEYFKNKNIEFKQKEQVLEAIKIHSDGFDTENIIALALILADKLDVKNNRISSEGRKIKGNRQFYNILDIEINCINDVYVINFKTNSQMDIEELNDYYFTAKIFKAINSFFTKVEKEYLILLDNNEWILNNYTESKLIY